MTWEISAELNDQICVEKLFQISFINKILSVLFQKKYILETLRYLIMTLLEI